MRYSCLEAVLRGGATLLGLMARRSLGVLVPPLSCKSLREWTLFATEEVLFVGEEERPPERSALVHGICHAVMEYDFQFYTKETDLATFQGVELSSVQLSRSELGPWNRITYRRAIGSAGWWIDIKVH